MLEDGATRSDPDAFRRLCEAPLRDLAPAEWDAYDPRMAAWLAHGDPESGRARSSVSPRLCSGPSPPTGAARPRVRQASRRSSRACAGCSTNSAAIPTRRSSASRAHLASVYDRLHLEADPHRVRRITGWRPDATLYALRQGGSGADGDPWRDVAVLHPAGREAFSHAEAGDLVDAPVPPALRGAPSRYLFARDGTGPCRSGNRETQAYASGVLVTLTGDPEARRWRRIRVIARGLQGRWTPFDLAAEDGWPQPGGDGGGR